MWFRVSCPRVQLRINFKDSAFIVLRKAGLEPEKQVRNKSVGISRWCVQQNYAESKSGIKAKL
jgi:hypothetical protein